MVLHYQNRNLELDLLYIDACALFVYICSFVGMAGNRSVLHLATKSARRPPQFRGSTLEISRHEVDCLLRTWTLCVQAKWGNFDVYASTTDFTSLQVHVTVICRFNNNKVVCIAHYPVEVAEDLQRLEKTLQSFESCVETHGEECPHHQKMTGDQECQISPELEKLMNSSHKYTSIYEPDTDENDGGSETD